YASQGSVPTGPRRICGIVVASALVISSGHFPTIRRPESAEQSHVHVLVDELNRAVGEGGVAPARVKAVWVLGIVAVDRARRVGAIPNNVTATLFADPDRPLPTKEALRNSHKVLVWAASHLDEYDGIRQPIGNLCLARHGIFGTNSQV